jgi:hypothetical protein
MRFFSTLCLDEAEFCERFRSMANDLPLRWRGADWRPSARAEAKRSPSEDSFFHVALVIVGPPSGRFFTRNFSLRPLGSWIGQKESFELGEDF